MEVKAVDKGQLFIPAQYADAYFLQKTGWTWDQLRTCPAWIVEQIRYIWHIENVAADANKPKPRK